MSQDRPLALVTGCASGFGEGLVVALRSAGWRVVETDATFGDDSADRRRLDVTSADDVARVATHVGLRLDLLVNNAGYAVFGTQEEVPIGAVARLFDVNVLGVARVTQALLPALRAARGTVVQLASVAGRTAFPESGYYAATKHAVEAMSEALVQEVGPHGVRVRVVEPGSFDTRFGATAARMSPVPPADSPYAGQRVLWQQRKAAVLEPPQDRQLVVRAILASLEDPRPFSRVIVGPDSERILALRDRLGPAAWTRLAADRNGVAPGSARGPDELPSASVALRLASDDPAWELLRFAYRCGHLDHFADDAEGRLVLARFAAE